VHAFSRTGIGDSVFDMPLDVSRIHIVGTYTGNTGGGGAVSITNSSGVSWSFEELR
jgi:hypothetical protein